MTDPDLYLRCQLAPIETADGRLVARKVGVQSSLHGPAFGEQEGVTLGRNRFSIVQPTRNVIDLPGVSGLAQHLSLGRPKVTVRVDLACLSPAETRSIHSMLRSGRPWALGAWYDEYTQAMSTFAGLDQRLGGILQVGPCSNSQIRRRDSHVSSPETGDWWEHPTAGANALVGGLTDSRGRTIPKLVPGMIGSAYLFERGGIVNLANKASGSWWNSVQPGGTYLFTGSRTPHPLGHNPAAFIDHASIAAQTGTATYPSGTYLDGVNQTGLTIGDRYQLSVLMRGAGRGTLLWHDASDEDMVDFVADGDWRWYSLEFVPAATSGVVRIHSGDVAGKHALNLEIAHVQIVKADYRCSLMDYAAAQSPAVNDAIRIVQPIDWPVFTFAAYIRFHNTDIAKPLLFYRPDNNADKRFSLSYRGDDLQLEDVAGTTTISTDALAGIAEGAWAQVVLVRDCGSDLRVRNNFYVNGVLKSSSNNGERQGPLLSNANADDYFYVGGDYGLDQANGQGSLQGPMDRFRLDTRAWTAAEVKADYDLHSHSGTIPFLQMVEGRFFAPSPSLEPFSNQVDLYKGFLLLEEVSQRHQGAY